MTHDGVGCWQVLYDDPEVEVVPVANTTLAIRPFGLVLYSGSSFIHIRVPKGRRPQGWPPSPSAMVEYFRGSTAAGGWAGWQETRSGWIVEHRIEMAPDPRLEGTRVTYEVAITGDRAEVHLLGAGRDDAVERWRRLSGPGISPLVGAWEQRSDQDRWLYLVTAGHFGVMRADLDRPAIGHDAELTDDEVASLVDTCGANAGAHVMTPGTFDHWPMIASSVAGYEIRKHQTFRLVDVAPNQFRATLPGLPGDDVPGTWVRRTQ